MRTKRQGMYYVERKVIDSPVIENDEEADWWTATDIQREIKRLYGRYVSLTKIGRVAKAVDLVKDSGYGFKLYHKDIIKYLCE